MTDSEFVIIRGGRLVDVAGRRAEPTDILIAGDTIREIGRPGLETPTGARTIDASNNILMPGLVNAHMHGQGGLAKGQIDDRWPLELLLNAGPGLSGNRSLEDKYLSGLIGAVEMVRKGCTACYDLFFEFPAPTLDGLEAVGRAYADVGMRAVIAPMVADYSLYEALPGLREAFPDVLRAQADTIRLAPGEVTGKAMEKAFRNWPFDRSRIRPAVAPTIPLHCSDEFLIRCRDLARRFDLPLQTHLAESKTQAVLGIRKYGKTLTAHLEDLGVLGPSCSAAHAIWLDPDDLGRLADHGVSAVHCPLSNMRFGSGLATVRPMLDRGVNVGIATDATNSSDSLNMFEATRLAALISRVQTPDYRRWLGADEVLTMATAGSARAMGWQDAIGRIAAGYKADLVFVDATHINYVPLRDATRQIVFTENGAAVDSVMIGGRMVLEHGRLTTVDEGKMRTDVERAVERLVAVNAPLRRLAQALEPVVGMFCLALCRAPYHVNRYASGEDR